MSVLFLVMDRSCVSCWSLAWLWQFNFLEQVFVPFLCPIILACCANTNILFYKESLTWRLQANGVLKPTSSVTSILCVVCVVSSAFCRSLLDYRIAYLATSLCDNRPIFADFHLCDNCFQTGLIWLMYKCFMMILF